MPTPGASLASSTRYTCGMDMMEYPDMVFPGADTAPEHTTEAVAGILSFYGGPRSAELGSSSTLPAIRRPWQGRRHRSMCMGEDVPTVLKSFAQAY